MKDAFVALCEKGLKIFIDCEDMEELMTDSEKKSLYKQLELCYAFNKNY